MASKKLQVPKGVLPAFELLIKHADQLATLETVVNGIDPADRLIPRIAKDFAARTGIPPSDARTIVTQVNSFHQLRGGMQTSPSELYEAITESLSTEAPPEWREKNLVPWKGQRNKLVALMSPSHPLAMVQKTTKLRYEHQNVLHETKILTDVRPVFDDAANELKLMNVGFVLEIEYHDGTQKRHLFAALDAKDVAQLKAECERAQTKTFTLREGLKPLNIPVLVSGDVDDE